MGADQVRFSPNSLPLREMGPYCRVGKGNRKRGNCRPQIDRKFVFGGGLRLDPFSLGAALPAGGAAVHVLVDPHGRLGGTEHGFCSRPRLT